jgi:Fic family protein
VARSWRSTVCRSISEQRARHFRKKKAVAADSITDIHRRFCAALPDDLLWVEDPATKDKIKVIPGALRDRAVAVGRHVPISAPALPRFLQRFEEVGKLGKTDTIVATAAAHHRLLWIHPFLDGNGRVARLMSHATLLDALDTAGVWSIARASSAMSSPTNPTSPPAT